MSDLPYSNLSVSRSSPKTIPGLNLLVQLTVGLLGGAVNKIRIWKMITQSQYEESNIRKEEVNDRFHQHPVYKDLMRKALQYKLIKFEEHVTIEMCKYLLASLYLHSLVEANRSSFFFLVSFH